ncbi:hypothetical protein J6590_034129 [Homalodisca vitripennis]|nr:hypothetical protein J6590_034129 [Homalodisca vitripennis]
MEVLALRKTAPKLTRTTAGHQTTNHINEGPLFIKRTYASHFQIYRSRWTLTCRINNIYALSIQTQRGFTWISLLYPLLNVMSCSSLSTFICYYSFGTYFVLLLCTVSSAESNFTALLDRMKFKTVGGQIRAEMLNKK